MGTGGVPRPKTTWKNARANVSAYLVKTKDDPRERPGLLDSKRLVSVTADDLHRLIATLQVRDRTWAPAEKALPADQRPVRWKPADADTKDKAASIVRLMFNAAHEAGVLEVNPAQRLRTVWGDRARTARVVIPSIVQVEQLAEAMDEEWPGRGDIIRLFAYTGLRWENACGLSWDDVDLGLRSMYVWRARPSSTGELVEYLKGGDQDGYLTIIDEALGPVERLAKFAADRDSEWLLTGERGGPLSYGLWRKHLDRAREASGVSYTAHQLRHVCASMLIAGGSDINDVREQMLHRTTQVTQRVYRHALRVDRRELAKRLRMPTTGIEADDSVTE